VDRGTVTNKPLNLNTAGARPKEWIHVRLQVDETDVKLFFDHLKVYVPIEVSVVGTDRVSGTVGFAGWGAKAHFRGLEVSLKGVKPVVHKWRVNGKDMEVNGIIDDLRIWDHPRPSEEIRKHHRTLMRGTEKGLYLYWPFDEHTGFEVFDETAHMVHGQIVGVPKEGLWVHSDCPLEKSNRESSKGVESCWNANAMPASSFCSEREWVSSGECGDHEGCFSGAGGLSKQTISRKDLTTALCRDHCLYHGYEFAAMRQGHTCSCGSDFLKEKAVCNTACSGDKKEVCGDTDNMSVYKTGFYRGCYKDSPNVPDLEHRALVKIKTVRECRQYCRGDGPKSFMKKSSTSYRYAGVQTDEEGRLSCRCGMALKIRHRIGSAESGRKGSAGMWALSVQWWVHAHVWRADDAPAVRR
jgi:hypothetical protein